MGSMEISAELIRQIQKQRFRIPLLRALVRPDVLRLRLDFTNSEYSARCQLQRMRQYRYVAIE